jgi:hypothetical protein
VNYGTCRARWQAKGCEHGVGARVLQPCRALDSEHQQIMSIARFGRSLSILGELICEFDFRFVGASAFQRPSQTLSTKRDALSSGRSGARSGPIVGPSEAVFRFGVHVRATARDAGTVRLSIISSST